ncbi:MAG TPA: BTAD domain-containing putative transcriptional regulator [Streptosporangiaceae bacterium]|nr:BTAD domain-containing putative transcriptional regulator [Streptosporangiaceae bacterium]
MEFRILGPLYADPGTDVGPAAIGQPLLRSALAVLLLRANMTCPSGFLIEALWDSEPPSCPAAALRVCISRLRRCLGDCAIRLQSIGPPGGRAPAHRQQRGYVMVVRPGELDVDEFTDLAAQAQAELDAGNAAAAAASFVHALALWGDPPLPDLPHSAVIAAAVEGLRAQRESVQDSLIDARLAAGEHEQVLGQLRAAVLADPGQERTCAQLMTACHALGLRKEALHVFQIARKATLEQQGAEPGPVLTDVYKQILADETAIARSARQAIRVSAAPTFLGAQVPAPPADFTGRSDAIAVIHRRVTSPGVPVVVVRGGPGMGKSATVAAAALELRRHFPDGQLYAELGGTEHPRDPEEVLADMLQAMGVPIRGVPSAGPARAALYRSLLAGRRVLVIADDAATAAQVRPLIPAPDGAAVVVTSRSRLGGLAGASIVELGELPDDDALTLLSLIAGRDRIASEPAAAGVIVRICAGMPLALRLAGITLAARPGLRVTGLARDMQRGGALCLQAEDVSVQAAIGSSYRSVSGAAKSALSRLAVTAPDAISARQLADLAGPSVVDELAAAGLLTPGRMPDAGEHYSIHPLVRAYAAQQLLDNTELLDNTKLLDNAELSDGVLTRKRVG